MFSDIDYLFIDRITFITNISIDHYLIYCTVLLYKQDSEVNSDVEAMDIDKNDTTNQINDVVIEPSESETGERNTSEKESDAAVAEVDETNPDHVSCADETLRAVETITTAGEDVNSLPEKESPSYSETNDENNSSLSEGKTKKIETEQVDRKSLVSESCSGIEEPVSKKRTETTLKTSSEKIENKERPVFKNSEIEQGGRTEKTVSTVTNEKVIYQEFREEEEEEEYFKITDYNKFYFM